jgi:hypothetical protein
MHSKGTFDIKSWDEKPISEGNGLPKITRAIVSKTFAGEIEGTSTLEYLMMYRKDGSANFVGMERIVGRVGGKSGSFVLQHTGVFEAGTAKSVCPIVPGSGTGELLGIRGEAHYAATHTSRPITLDYDFERTAA